MVSELSPPGGDENTPTTVKVPEPQRWFAAWTLARLIGGNNCVVPNLRGKTIGKAISGLKRSYCRRGRISRRFSGKVARGRVIATAPRLGARLPGGAKVGLVVSKGKRPRP